MTITKLIKKHGGTTKFRKKLFKNGVDIPEQTVKCWSAQGNTHSEPNQWSLRLLELVLK